MNLAGGSVVCPSEGSIVLHYPKIPGSRNAPNARCVAFEKYDGTNLHWDWDRDYGWHAFGTRRDAFNFNNAGIELFTAAHAHLQQCVDVFRATLATELERVFLDNPIYQGVPGFQAFTEFFGPNSFAGLHREDDPKELRLFDVSVDGFGMLGPDEFARDFRHLPIAQVVYRGRLTGKFADDVRAGRYPVTEGVICKGGTGGRDLWMVKIKTDAYMARLKQAFADAWEDHWE